MTMSLAQVATALRTKGIPASYEYPGFLLVDDGEHQISFGFANERFGWDTSKPDGQYVSSGESPTLTDTASVDDLIACVESVLAYDID